MTDNTETKNEDTLTWTPELRAGLRLVSWEEKPELADVATRPGVKHDTDKLLWNLLPFGPVTDVVEVLTYGAKVYSPDNWKRVQNPRERYFAAAMRHLTAWWCGERLDPESKLPHLAHATTCLLFLAAFDNEKKP